MLWLPTWLRDDAPAPREDGVTRRAFLCLGAAAAVGAVVPAPAAQLADVPMQGVHIPTRQLYARVRITGPEMFLGGRRGGKSSAFLVAAHHELAALVNDIRLVEPYP